MWLVRMIYTDASSLNVWCTFVRRQKRVEKRELGKETSQNWLHKLTLVAIRGSKVVFMHYKTKGKRVSNKQYGLEEKDLNQPPICDSFFYEISIFRFESLQPLCILIFWLRGALRKGREGKVAVNCNRRFMSAMCVRYAIMHTTLIRLEAHTDKHRHRYRHKQT